MWACSQLVRPEVFSTFFNDVTSRHSAHHGDVLAWVNSSRGVNNVASAVRLGGVDRSSLGLVTLWLLGRAGGCTVSWCLGLAAALVLGVADSELSGVLVLASGIVNQLNAVALGSLGRDQVGLRSPRVSSVVWCSLNNWVLWDGVLTWALEEHKCDGALGGRVPGDGEWLASWDNGVEARLSDWVALMTQSVFNSNCEIRARIRFFRSACCSCSNTDTHAKPIATLRNCTAML